MSEKEMLRLSLENDALILIALAGLWGHIYGTGSIRNRPDLTTILGNRSRFIETLLSEPPITESI